MLEVEAKNKQEVVAKMALVIEVVVPVFLLPWVVVVVADDGF